MSCVIQDKSAGSVKEKTPFVHKVYESDFKNENAVKQAFTRMFALS
jgi:hypothetical protein